ncbi:response regulator [Patescibacteria group bacterium]|nr:response regulator [Patescibacteria group bacterium]MBU1501015.1 response regulator [Patescibacteria group bacterium]MBU2080645.1 response regulator [Patescibacteria group bacterium]MBU2124280.1 response regulator [Patescibacteria group bacterium]MBU2194406.1 response regulator [Patescibacteria group bacterium]
MKHILIVDDNHAAADGIVRLLKVLGWSASAQYSGKEALEYVKDNSTALAFIDIGMPDMDGHATVVALRAAGHEFPAIALTGYGQKEDVDKALAAGFTAHITKPVGVEELKKSLETHL